MALSVSAMSIAELYEYLINAETYESAMAAIEALGIQIIDVGAAGASQVTLGGAPAAISSTTQTALELATGASLNATAKNVASTGIGLLQGETATKVGALMSADIGVIAPAVAPLLGVAIGADLYSSNPQFWSDLSVKLLPFCYPGTTRIPTWGQIVDDAWQMSIPKYVVDSVKSLFDEEMPEHYPSYQEVPQGVYYTGGNVLNVINSITWDSDEYQRVLEFLYSGTTEGAVIFRISKGWAFPATILWGTVNTELGRNSTGRAITYRATADGAIIDSLSDHATVTCVEDSLFDLDGSPARTYVTGTSKWTGTTPSEIPVSEPAVIGIDSTTLEPITQPMVPISLPFEGATVITQPQPEVEVQTVEFPWPEPEGPHTEPWPTEMPWPLPAEQPSWWPVEIPYPKYPVQYPSANPEVQPNPTTVTDPVKQVEPYVMPLPVPNQVATPTQQAVADPVLDPSKPRPPSEDVVELNPPIELGPLIPPIGVSPWPSIPTTPLPFSQNAGFVTVYHPTSSQLYSFEEWLWVTYADATIDKTFNNPFDGVISLFELYCTPTDVGTQSIKSGFLDSGINSSVISRYTEINCGTLGIPEYYGNYFDYSPYSKAHIYLPFIGIQELNVDDIVGHTVNVTYRIDEYNGSCIAMITVAKVTEVNGEDVEYSNTMYQFSGNCSVELPFAGGTQASIKAGFMTANAYQQASMISAGASLLGGLGSLLTGSVGGAISGLGNAASTLAYGNANALSNMLSGKSTVQKSGQFGSSHGALGIKKPFITITRPKQIQVPNYNELYGYPAHKMVTVGNCTGFLRCREVNVVSATASDDEKSLIEQLLKTGVYVTE